MPGTARADPPQCLSLAWSADGQTLFAGYSDNLIRVWQVCPAINILQLGFQERDLVEAQITSYFIS